MVTGKMILKVLTGIIIVPGSMLLKVLWETAENKQRPRILRWTCVALAFPLFCIVAPFGDWWNDL